ncbi:MAG: type II toxin-antitoxin system PemK/MazF family toxin [Planctomycetales bacterium]|nr:type II toxin-antitoxin system PemK/MazF family toxin [Planctomycetales bacterium]
MDEPMRGEVWMVDLDPTRGREQAGRRPALVVSTNTFNRGPAGLVIVLPITSKAKGIPLHVELEPPDGGLKKTSYVKCEDIRSIAKERLAKRWGAVSAAAMREVDKRLAILLEL